MFAGKLTPQQVGDDVTRGIGTWFPPFAGR
jgi:hypothetical protein